MPANLRRGFPLHGDTASFRVTESNMWSSALILGINLVGIGVLLLVLLAWKEYWAVIAGVGGVGALLAYLGARNKTTWRLNIKRSTRTFLVTRNSVPVPSSAVDLVIVKRPAIGYSLAMLVKNGPTIYLAASKSQVVLEALQKELMQCLAESMVSGTI
ncbi:hypothetical protein JXO59_04410 [candidate division KSB1 bacterium]|nr:hypothetical protein [candidate division KSB1 bacterium]